MNFARLLPQTITRKQQSGVGSHGDPTYGSGSTMAARVQMGRDRQFEAIEHEGVLYTETELLVTDRVWLPGDSTSDDKLARRPLRTVASPSLGASQTLYKTAF